MSYKVLLEMMGETENYWMLPVLTLVAATAPEHKTR